MPSKPETQAIACFSPKSFLERQYKRPWAEENDFNVMGDGEHNAGLSKEGLKLQSEATKSSEAVLLL